MSAGHASDPVAHARSLGITVVAAIMEGRYVGALRQQSGCPPLLVLNELQTVDCQRAICAELVSRYLRFVHAGTTDFAYIL